MNYSCKTIIVFFVCSVLMSCGPRMPESYGVYATAKDGFIALKSQTILFKGNLIQSVTGLNEPSGTEFDSVESFIIFLEGLKSDSIQLSNLTFRRSDQVPNLSRKAAVEVNMWVSANALPCDIALVSSKPNMYKLTPKAPLPQGFYAIHFGGLNRSSTIEASAGKIAYDFTIGSAKNYPSYEVIKKQNEEKLTNASKELIEQFNNLFNDGKFSEAGEVYWPNGNKMYGETLTEYTEGASIWLEAAGKVKNYHISDSNISEYQGLFTVQAEYEKAGQQSERFEIKKIDENFRITSIE